MGIPEEEKEKKRTEELFEVIFLKLMTNKKPNPRSPGNIKHMNIKNKQQQQQQKQMKTTQNTIQNSMLEHRNTETQWERST